MNGISTIGPQQKRSVIEQRKFNRRMNIFGFVALFIGVVSALLVFTGVFADVVNKF